VVEQRINNLEKGVAATKPSAKGAK
jgi:hypothetical protein